MWHSWLETLVVEKLVTVVSTYPDKHTGNCASGVRPLHDTFFCKHEHPGGLLLLYWQKHFRSVQSYAFVNDVFSIRNEISCHLGYLKKD